jgi:hypothetical protein
VKNKHSITNTINRYILNFIQTQLIVTIAAIPILVNCGLSISLMTFIANLLFSPVLTIFLMLSALVFFTQLLHIPNHLLIILLDRFTQLWDQVLACGKHDWLIEFCKPPAYMLLAIPVATIILFYAIKCRTAIMRIGVMTGMLFVSITGLWLLPRIYSRPLNDTNTLQSSKITIHRNENGKFTLIDNGFFSRHHSPEKVVEFDLKPYLVKQFGTIHFKELIFIRPGQRTFVGAKALCTLFTVDKITIPYFEKKLSKGGWRAFFDLKRKLEEKEIEFCRNLI